MVSASEALLIAVWIERQNIVRPSIGERRPMMRIVESVAGHYDVQEVEFGKVYRWRPGYIVLECGCGEKQALTCFMATCSECGADYAAVAQEELAGQSSEEKALHSWRYAGERQGLGLPY
jgi:hypothetical protein